jgi:surfactin family lipopeptide synthetase A
MAEAITELRRKQLLESYFRTHLKTAVEQPTEIPPGPAHGRIPLTVSQKQLWLHAQLAPDTALYNEPLTVRHRGPLDVGVLQKAFNEIIRRHEAWRTTFPLVDGEPVQQVLAPFFIDLTEIDLRALNPQDREKEATRLATADARIPFDLERGPLFRAKLVRLDEQEHRLYITLHHLIFDGFSGYRILLPELVALYEAFLGGKPSPLPALPFQFGDFALWQRERMQGAQLEASMEYWRGRLAPPLPSLQIPYSHPVPPVQTFGGAMYSASLPLSLSEALRELCRREGVTLYMALLAAFNVLLYRYSGQEDILIGSNTAGRNHSGSEKLLGYFLNTIPLRSDLSGDPTFRELLDRIRGTTLEALSHDEVPLDRVVAELHPERDPNRNPLFQILFSLEPPLSRVSPEWDLTCIEVETGATKFELCMVLDDRADGLLCRLIYNTALFDAEAAGRMAGHWQTLLESVAENPGLPISECTLLTQAEREQILVEWNDTAEPYTPEPLPDLVRARAQHQVEKPAVRCGPKEISYGELDRRSDRLTRVLRSMGVGPKIPVALCLDRSVDMVVAILGVLKAGGAYVPLDTANPRQRLELMLDDCKPRVLLTQQDTLGVSLSTAAPTLFLDAALSETKENPPVEIRNSVPGLDDLAYILYTSGSTGVPKGVQVTHRNLAYSNQARLNYYKDAPERFLLLSSYSFDSSVAGIFHTLTTGGTLVIPPADFRWDGQGIQRLVSENKVTHLLAVPSLYAELLANANANHLASLRSVIVAGEACPRQLVNLHYEILPQCSLFNEYGPTEATVWSTVFECEPGGAESSVPIGRPIANAQTYILDRHLQPVPIGVPGELYVGGQGVARGYLNQPALTEKYFVPDAFSSHPDARLYRTGDLARYLPAGDIEFLGRSDQQVKLRGMRVELDEIEALLAEHGALREAAVVATRQSSGEAALSAFVVPQDRELVSTSELRSFLKTRLPSYMIPGNIQVRESLPKSSSGKIDRQKLAAEGITISEITETIAAPRDEAERRLLSIWKQVFPHASDDVNQDFFQLGGHSLLAAKLLVRIEKEFSVQLSLAFVFESPTIARMAQALRLGSQNVSERAIVPIQPKGVLAPFFWIRGGPRFRLLAQHLGMQRPFLGVDLPYSVGVKLPAPYRLEDIAAYLLKAIREVQPSGPYHLGGLCVNAVIAYEIGQQLIQQGEKVALLAMIDAHNHAYYKNPFKDGRYTARIKFHLSNLLRMDSTETGAYLRDRLDEARRKIERITWRLTADRRDRAEDFRNSDSIVHPAFSQYEPRPYPGKIVLLQSSEWPKSPYFEFKLGWEDLVPEIEFHRIPSDHAYLFDEPNVKAVAQTLKVYLKGSPERE